ncbi:YggS family pyridoxal phosphate-dependent enzyme [Georgenia thermotolerans]|uniref:Pyridoxal phosphate homeostasis protein n=1 Tax=Georgenia thermotolerans TaxID=527326 RepID=A0A7J5UQW5_9MICO|nr:YggS family pyridoxal phosphate-dependent enzyme [Georgenia thermotolerans]KAE8764600.1 YggS family pyridoxal phosphate-dependent enzyme [Georgenia thermotolerans]
MDVAAGIAARLGEVRRRVAAAADDAGRDPREVRVLLAVKTQPVEAIRAALEAGADLLGHNRAQELVATGPGLAEPGVPAHAMHFIGHLQSNKVNQVLRWASCVQTVDSLRLAERLDQAVARADAGAAPDGGAAPDDGTRARAAGEPLDVLVQVNTSGEATKAGVDPAQARELALAVGRLPHLRLRGFMTIGANTPDAEVVRRSYDRLAEVRADVLGTGAPGTAEATELSMGMSGDLEIAVAAGATIVRVGTAVFGARPKP